MLAAGDPARTSGIGTSNQPESRGGDRQVGRRELLLHPIEVKQPAHAPERLVEGQLLDLGHTAQLGTGSLDCVALHLHQLSYQCMGGPAGAPPRYQVPGGLLRRRHQDWHMQPVPGGERGREPVLEAPRRPLQQHVMPGCGPGVRQPEDLVHATVGRADRVAAA
jgi:hypothetical protein